jgi:hypothetical protein
LLKEKQNMSLNTASFANLDVAVCFTLAVKKYQFSIVEVQQNEFVAGFASKANRGTIEVFDITCINSEFDGFNVGRVPVRIKVERDVFEVEKGYLVGHDNQTCPTD